MSFLSKSMVTLCLWMTCCIAGAQTLLNEFKVNPPGPDEYFEFAEIKGIPGSTLNNLYLCVFEGDSGSAGNCDCVFAINNVTLGSTGLYFFGTTLGYPAVPSGTLYKDTLLFAVPGGVFENGSVSFMLIFSPVPIVKNSDYDQNDDGTLELPAGANVLDAVGWTNGDPSSRVYGGVALTQSVGTPDAAVRFFGNNTANSVSAWYCGDVTGNGNTTQFDPLEQSANFPAGGALTPGGNNLPNPSFLSERDAHPRSKVSPNPCSEQIRVNTVGFGAEKTMIRLLTSDGRVLFQIQADAGHTDLQLHPYEAGYYLIEVSSPNRKEIHHICRY